jgi:hypothetical protein
MRMQLTVLLGLERIGEFPHICSFLKARVEMEHESAKTEEQASLKAHGDSAL